MNFAQIMFSKFSGIAKKYESPVFNGIFSHFRKEKDEKLRRGKLEEELKRMKDIVNLLGSKSLVLLFN